MSKNKDKEDVEEDMAFLFKFSRGKWKSKEYHPFELIEKYDPRNQGTFDKFWDKKQHHLMCYFNSISINHINSICTLN